MTNIMRRKNNVFFFLEHLRLVNNITTYLSPLESYVISQDNIKGQWIQSFLVFNLMRVSKLVKNNNKHTQCLFIHLDIQ